MKRNGILVKDMITLNDSDLIIIFNQANIEDVSKLIEYDCEHHFSIVKHLTSQDDMIAICDDVDYEIFSKMCKELTCKIFTYTELDFLDYEKDTNIFDNKIVTSNNIYSLHEHFEELRDTLHKAKKLIFIIDVNNKKVHMDHLKFLEELTRQFSHSIYLTTNAKDYIEMKNLDFSHREYYRIESSMVEGEFIQITIEPGK